MGVREYRDVARVYLDMDGVLADFEGMSMQRKVPPAKLKLEPGVYLSLAPVAGAAAAVARIVDLGYDIFVLTKIPSQNPHAAYEKLVWLKEHFPVFGDHVIITPDKGAIGSSRDFLIDDHPEWANALRFRGRVIRFQGSWSDTLDSLSPLSQ